MTKVKKLIKKQINCELKDTIRVPARDTNKAKYTIFIS